MRGAGQAPPTYRFKRSSRAGKKWMVITPDGASVHFGQDGAQDFTMHKDPLRMVRYVQRHAQILPLTSKLGRRLADHETPVTHADMELLQSAKGRRENWSATGLNTPGFWARYALWLYPSLDASLRWIERAFGVRVVRA